MSLDRVRDLCAEAGACHSDGRLAEGLRLAEEAVELSKTTLGVGHYAYPLSLCALGALRQAAGFDGADAYDAAVVLARDLADVDFEHARTILTHAADYHILQGNRSKGRELLQELVALHGLHLGVDHPRYFTVKARLETLLDA